MAIPTRSRPPALSYPHASMYSLSHPQSQQNWNTNQNQNQNLTQNDNPNTNANANAQQMYYSPSNIYQQSPYALHPIPNINPNLGNAASNTFSPSGWGANPILHSNPNPNSHSHSNSNSKLNVNANQGYHDATNFTPNTNPVIPNGNAFALGGPGGGGGPATSNATAAVAGAAGATGAGSAHFSGHAFGGSSYPYVQGQGQGVQPGGTSFAAPFSQVHHPDVTGNTHSNPNHHASSFTNPTGHSNQSNPNHNHNRGNGYELQPVMYHSPYSTAAVDDLSADDERPVIPIPNPNGQGFVLLHHQQRREGGRGGGGGGSGGGGSGNGSRGSREAAAATWGAGGGEERHGLGPEEHGRGAELQPVPPAYAITGPHPAWGSAWADPNGPFAVASDLALAGGEDGAPESRMGGGARQQPAGAQHQHQHQQHQQPQRRRASGSAPASYPGDPSFAQPLPPSHVPPALGQQAQAQAQAPSHGVAPAPPPGIPPAPAHNTTEMTREMLIPVLDRFSELLLDYFDFSERVGGLWGEGGSPGSSGSGSGPRNDREHDKRPKQLRLAAHGGACMLLHPVFRSLNLEMPLVGAPMPGARAGANREVSSLDALAQQQQGLHNMKMENLARRTTTRDVDVIIRGFVDDYAGVRAPERWRASAAPARPVGGVGQYGSQYPVAAVGGHPGYSSYGAPAYTAEEQDDSDPDSPRRAAHLDVAGRLKACIRRTTRYFPGLGLDWMNADADVALPLGADPQTHQAFDPIHRSTFTQNNVHQYTVYTSPNGRLQLVSVPPAWSIALKIARWGRRDFADVGILLRSATTISGIQWTPEMLQGVLERDCWAMGYSRFDERRTKEFKERIGCAVRMVEGWRAGAAHGQAQAHGQVNGYGYGQGYGQTGGNELGLYMYGQTAQSQQRPRSMSVAAQQQQPPPRRDDREWEREDARAARMASAQARMGRSPSRRSTDWNSRSRSKSRARSQSNGPHEIFIPPDDDEDEDYTHRPGYGFEEVEDWRGRGHARQISRSIPVGVGGIGGGPSSVLPSTAVAPFQRHPHQNSVQSPGTHGPRLWRRRSVSRTRNTERDKKAKQRDRQRRIEQQRRNEERADWSMPPIVPIDTDDDSGSGSEDAGGSGNDTDNTDDEEGEKENRDRASAWRQANIYGPSKKRPTPLNMPHPLTNEQALRKQQQEQQERQREARQPLYAQHPYAQQVQANPQLEHQRQLSRTQSHPHLFSESQSRPQPRTNPVPYPTPQPELPSGPLPANANPAQLAQFQFEQQMRSLQYERQYELSVKDTMERIAKRVVTRGSTL